MAVFVIGAGTTRGASFTKEDGAYCLPPLDADFFSQLQRIRNQKHKALIAAIIKDATELFGFNFSVTYETVFSTLEQMIKMVETTRERRGFQLRHLRPSQNRLLQGIAAVFEESLTQVKGKRSTHEMKACKFHKKLVESLTTRDTLISFNYDCLLDNSLRLYGDGKWNPRYGYGFKLGSRGANLTGDGYWTPSNPALKKDSVRYYKLHGSMHFRIDNDQPGGQSENYQIDLKERPYTKQKGALKFSVIPPESNKRYDLEPYASLWKHAGDEVHRASCLVVIGYSFPPTDLHSSALFRVSIGKGKLKSLVVVNPDKNARSRARDILKRGISGKTRILVFDTLEEFVRIERSHWDS